jgi:hypothetical protein
MGAFVTAGKNEMLDASSITHAALFDGDPDAGGTAIAGARQACTLGAAAAGTITVAADATFAIAAGETVSWVGYYNALTAGTLLGTDELPAAEGPYGSDGDYVLEESVFSLT